MTIVIKYGGNAMIDTEMRHQAVAAIAQLHRSGAHVVMVHGGGPFIRQRLERAGIPSRFAGGHRVTTPAALEHIEYALKGEVNSMLVGELNRTGQRAVGLSGKDGRMVTVRKYEMETPEQGEQKLPDLGRVGRVVSVDTTLIHWLVDTGYLPVVTCIATDAAGVEYNVNADMFAGHLAGALGADHFLVLTDVDGLMADLGNPDSRIARLVTSDIEQMKGSVINGGMLPKIEACRVALVRGAGKAQIINGCKPDQIHTAIFSEQPIGTEVCQQ